MPRPRVFRPSRSARPPFPFSGRSTSSRLPSSSSGLVSTRPLWNPCDGEHQTWPSQTKPNIDEMTQARQVRYSTAQCSLPAELDAGRGHWLCCYFRELQCALARFHNQRHSAALTTRPDPPSTSPCSRTRPVMRPSCGPAPRHNGFVSSAPRSLLSLACADVPVMSITGPRPLPRWFRRGVASAHHSQP